MSISITASVGAKLRVTKPAAASKGGNCALVLLYLYHYMVLLAAGETAGN